jgi:hypothetical protein
MHVPPLQALLKETPEMLVGPVSVPVPVDQFTANLQKFKEVEVILSKKLRDPVGGSVVPSKSAGSRL